MNYKIIENGLIPVMENEQGEKLVNARELHEILEVRTKFADWIKEKISKYGFEENVDFISFSEKAEKPLGGRPSTEYVLTIDTAKEIAMVENNSKGKEVRKYFIEVEKKHKQLVKALVKDSKAGGLNGLLKTLNSVMKEEKISAHQRAEVLKDVAEQCGLKIPESFVKKPEFIQISLTIPMNQIQ